MWKCQSHGNSQDQRQKANTYDVLACQVVLDTDQDRYAFRATVKEKVKETCKSYRVYQNGHLLRNGGSDAIAVVACGSCANHERSESTVCWDWF